MVDSIHLTSFTNPAIPTYGIGNDLLSEIPEIHGGATIPVVKQQDPKSQTVLTEQVVNDIEDDDALFFDCEDPDVESDDDALFFDCEDPDVESVNVLKEQPMVAEEAPATQSWTNWASNLTSYVMNGILSTDDESCYVTNEQYETDYSEWYVENEEGGLTPKWIHNADKIADFSESIVGSKLIETGKGMIGENGGMLIGAVFPEASIAYATGKAIANNMVGESENKSTIVEGAGIAAATIIALTKGLTYLTGTPMEYGQALGYMVSAAGTIAGGMNGLEAVGKEVPENYIPRTAAYLVTTGVVGKTVSAVTSLPLPTPISTTVAVSGKVLTAGSALAAYNAPEVMTLVDKVIHSKPQLKNLSDPGEALKEIMEHTSIVESPLISSISQTLFKHMIDEKIGTNSIVRAVNDFSKIVQNKDIQQKIKAFKAAPDSNTKELLKKEIADLVERTYSPIEQKIAKVIQPKSDSFVKPLVTQLVELMSSKEVEYFGFELSSTAQTKDLLEILIPSLIPMIGVYADREIKTTHELDPKEIEAFYQNFNEMIFAPYNEYWLAKGAQGLTSIAFTVMQSAQFIPALFLQKIETITVDPIIILNSYASPETKTLVNNIIQPQPQKKNGFDLGNLLDMGIEHAQEDSSVLSASLTSQLVGSGFFSNIVQALIKHTIDKKLGTNALVKAVNDYVKIIQNPDIQQKIKSFKTMAHSVQRKYGLSEKDALKKEIAQLVKREVKSKYSPAEKGIAYLIQTQSDPHVKSLAAELVKMMRNKEVEYLGEEFSNAAQTQDLLEILVPSLIPMIVVYAKREELETTKDLTPEEIETFYQNFNAIIFNPYSDYGFAQEAQGLLSTAIIPLMQQYAQGIPKLLAEKIGQSMVHPIITFDDDADFEIATSPKVEEKPKMSTWESIRAKLSLIKFMIQLGGMKKFMKIAGNVIFSFFMKNAKKPMGGSGGSSGDSPGTGQ